MQLPTHLVQQIGVVAALAGSASASQVIVVDAAGGGAFTSIQAAVNAALDGDVVLVRAGLYTEEVLVDGLSVTLVGEGDPVLIGHLSIRNLATSDVVLVSGVIVAPSGPGNFAYEGALDIRSALGRVRVQDCVLAGADREGPSPHGGAGSFISDGGPGLHVAMSADVALVDCTLRGGEGAYHFQIASGWGGDGVIAQDVARLSLVRTVSLGNDGALGDYPGDGGAGVRLVGATTLYVAYSACSGGEAGCFSGFPGVVGPPVNGGHGLVRGSGSTTYDFEGLYFGGAAAQGLCLPSSGSTAGAATSGGGTFNALPSGFPNTLHAPSVVREGQQWSLEVVASPGEIATMRYATETSFGFRPSHEQPWLLASPALTLLGSQGVIPGNSRLVLPQSPFQLAPVVEADVLWLQGGVAAAGGPATFTSARFVLRLDSAF